MGQLSLIREKGNLHFSGVDAGKIGNLLAEHHADDVFIPECKNGETWGARDLLKLDAWVLRRTYSPLTTIGYEIKCSRSDFEQDQKWVGYLDLCHLFYFVCPAGLIRSVDLPSRVGLIWVSQTEKLHVKRKAERVEPNAEKLNKLLIYALMARSKIVANMFDINKAEEPPRLQQLREVVERANEKKKLAYFVKAHIQEMAGELEKKESDLFAREGTVKKFEERLGKLGLTWNSETAQWQDNMRIENEIDLLKKRIDYMTLDHMRAVGNTLTKLVAEIESYRKGGD